MSKSILLKTALPGPKSKSLMVQRMAAIPRGPFHATPIFVSKAKGALVEDVDGNQLIDFASGIGVVNVGHTPESVVNAIQSQASKLLHSSFNVLPNESYVRLAEKLNKATPGSFPKKTLLVNSGAEAVENAVKIARAFTKRQTIVCFEHGYHGRTYMAMTLTSKVKPYRYGFGPFNSDVLRVPFPYAYRSPTTFEKVEEIINTQVSADSVAAIIIEPVLGEGGFIPTPKPFMQKLREYCTANGIVLIADEIQTGFGRTGTLFACEQLGVAPDLMTMAKGLGAGIPIAAVTGKAEIMDAPIEGGIGGTYGGNPVACAAAIAVFELFESGKILENAQKIGEILSSRLNQWKEKYPVIGDVRGLGPMQGIEFVRDRTTKEPFREAAGGLAKFCYERGLVILTAGTFGNVVRLLMPLVITSEQLEEGLQILESGIREIKL